MISIYRTESDITREIDTIEPGSWVKLVAPTEEEMQFVANKLNIELDFIKAATDEEERARLEIEEEATLILVDTPVVAEEQGLELHNAIPLGIIYTPHNIVTVCLRDVEILSQFHNTRVLRYSTKKKNRFVLQILYKNAAKFLFYLKQIDKSSTRVERELHKSMKNEELIQMLKLEKSLVYFSTSIKSNEVVMEKLLRMPFIKEYPDDLDLLEDVIIENKQAMEMCAIYRDILSGTMDAFASVISNNLNIVMKVLTSLTIVISVPTLIASLWGMNVNVPFAGSPTGFWTVLAISLACSLAAVIILNIKKLL
ncbi:MAG: magnesium transporter CorA family protein [Clostridia bacterium]|nr:magnesium transporter CorA family protein [Clostridia bacterium]